jgi:hypothetical protein
VVPRIGSCGLPLWRNGDELSSRGMSRTTGYGLRGLSAIDPLIEDHGNHGFLVVDMSGVVDFAPSPRLSYRAVRSITILTTHRSSTWTRSRRSAPRTHAECDRHTTNGPLAYLHWSPCRGSSRSTGCATFGIGMAFGSCRMG